MKQIFTCAAFLFLVSVASGQQWTEEQLQKANTFFDEQKQDDTEKQIMLYVNLCRLYPKEFAEKELKNYIGTANVGDKNFASYKASLLKELETRPPAQPLRPDELLYDDAKCYSNEIAKNNRKPHERVDCITRNYAECIYYGGGNAKDIAMQWLIDSGVESLGHRKFCLQPAFRKAGIKLNNHFEYKYCVVLELSK